MWYKIDWDRLILLLLPTFLRKAVLFGYLRALIAPIASLHYRWLKMRTDNIRKLSYNSQKCYLRKALNDSCDPELRRIYLDKVPQTENVYIYTPEENLDLFLDTVFLDLDYTENGENVQGVVYVPFSILNTKIYEITAVLEFYKLMGINYKIIGYE